MNAPPSESDVRISYYVAERSARMHAMVYFTARDGDDAARIARHLLEKRLIACANVFPVRSLYRWEGKLEDEPEAVAICKTRRSSVKRAIAEAKKVHAYEVPCVVSYAMGDALTEYAAWIDAETRGSRRRSGPTGSRRRRTRRPSSRRS